CNLLPSTQADKLFALLFPKFNGGGCSHRAALYATLSYVARLMANHTSRKQIPRLRTQHTVVSEQVERDVVVFVS
ncbi:MAG: hypothetical protein Q8M07_11825, partial [Prosthecobacter sp.]|nr:hypothetical protein [Prosthecobacter sp.]